MFDIYEENAKHFEVEERSNIFSYNLEEPGISSLSSR